MEKKGNCGYGMGTVVLAALGGAMVGATVALLLAPQSGRKTRRQIEGYVDNAKETLEGMPDALKKMSHAARDALQGDS